MKRFDLVVVGGGMAAAMLLEQLVANRYSGTVAVVCAEQTPCYNRVLLSEVLAGERPESALPMLDSGWIARHGIELICGQAVTRLDTDRQQVLLGENPIGYGRLVLATGAGAALPDIDGVTLPGVSGFRTLDDLRRFRDSVRPGDHVVVVGGGLLGLEAAHGLRALGAEVTVVHRNARLMNRQLDVGAASVLLNTLTRRGVRFRLQETVTAIEPGLHVLMSGGDRLDATQLIFATGIVPRTDLATAAGMRCNNAVVVDAYMRTSIEHCFALGECCEFDGVGFGLLAPIRRQADVLAATLCGLTVAGFEHVDEAVQLKVSGLDVFATGSLDGDSEQLLTDTANGIYRRLWFRGRKLAGAVLMGDRSGGNWYSDLIRLGTDVSDQRHLIFGPAFCTDLSMAEPVAAP